MAKHSRKKFWIEHEIYYGKVYPRLEELEVANDKNLLTIIIMNQ